MIAAQCQLMFAIAAWSREPGFRIEDAYKWLYQATLGGEHAALERAEAARWLAAEWKTLEKPLRKEPLAVKLRSDGSLVRLNLRPYKDRGGSRSRVLEAFLSSAKEFKAKKYAFIVEWKELGMLLKKKDIGALGYSQWSRLEVKARSEDYRAIDHSTVYQRVAKPAYRVLTKRNADNVLSQLSARGKRSLRRGAHHRNHRSQAHRFAHG